MIYRILGILWLALCGFLLYWFLWERYETILAHTENQTGICHILDAICLICFTGVVASVFLIRGTFWARILVSILAMLIVIYCIIFGIVLGFGLGAWAVVIAIFSLFSAFLLLFPRRYVAA